MIRVFEAILPKDTLLCRHALKEALLCLQVRQQCRRRQPNRWNQQAGLLLNEAKRLPSPSFSALLCWGKRLLALDRDEKLNPIWAAWSCYIFNINLWCPAPNAPQLLNTGFLWNCPTTHVPVHVSRRSTPLIAFSQDLRRFLHWGSSELGYPSLQSVVEAVPTAELEPFTEGGIAQVTHRNSTGDTDAYARSNLDLLLLTASLANKQLDMPATPFFTVRW